MNTAEPIVDALPVGHRLADGVSLHRLSPENDGHYFFGYYDKSPYNASGRLALAGRTTFADRMPTPDDALTVGLLDAEAARAGRPRFVPLAQTTAWCWQQSTMLQWLPPSYDRHIIFNCREGERFAARILDTRTGETRDLSRPVYAVDPRGRYAISLNFPRLANVRPGYGYEGGVDPVAAYQCPEHDGLWRVPLDGGEPILILSVRAATRLNALEEHRGVDHWFNHAQINTDGSRIACLHRWRSGQDDWRTRLITVEPNGGQAFVLRDSGFFSHYDWVDTSHILGWTDQPADGRAYVLLRDRFGSGRVIGVNDLKSDGHMSLSPDRSQMLSDTYADDESMRHLFLWQWPDGPRRILGQFYSPPDLSGPIRVDLHPRWRRDGQAVCVDSAHDGSRGMFEISLNSGPKSPP